MLRRYLVSLIGALAGGGIAFALGLRIMGTIFCVLGAAWLLMAFGERLGLVPPSEDVGRPTTLFSDDESRRC